jgi:zinc protease
VELPNGCVVLARPNFNSPSVVVTGYIQVGALLDPDEKLGLANFTASSLMRGTCRRTFQEIYDSLETAGASLGFDGGTHTTGFSGRALAEDLNLLLELAAESLRCPAFPEDQVKRLRTQLLTGLALRAQDTGDMASLAFDELVYAGHPYSRPEDGNTQTVEAIGPEQLAGFHSLHYGPRGMAVAVVGGVDPQAAVENVARVLGDWENPAQPLLPELPLVSPLQGTASRKVTIPGKSQADMVLGSYGPSRNAPEFLTAALGNNILGQFGMMGRIGEAVRQQAGLAYYASSSLGGGPGPGPWSVSAGVDPEDIETVIELIRTEIERFVSEPVGEDELADSQENFIGSLPLSLESNGGVAARLLTLERYGLGLDYYHRYPGLVRAVTREEVLETARRYLHPERLAIAIAGP